MRADPYARDGRCLAIVSAALCGGGAALIVLSKLVWSLAWYLPVLGLVIALPGWLALWGAAAVGFGASLVCGALGARRGARWAAGFLAADALALGGLASVGLLLLPVDPPFWTDWVANDILDWFLAAPAGLR